VRAPCLWRGPCPALVRPGDWCHAERSWSPPPLLDALARAAGLHKEELKMSYLVLAPRGEEWRGAAPRRAARGAAAAAGGGGGAGRGGEGSRGWGREGRMGLALQEKPRTAANQVFFSLHRGDVVAIEGTEPRGDGLALTAESTVQRLAPAGQPLRGV